MFDPQKVDPDLVLDISAKTGLHVNVVEQLLENGWSYKEDNNGHEWTLNALEAQRVHMIAPSMEIPVPMVAPFGVPMTGGGVEDVWNLYVKPGQDAGEIQSIEERMLMAILRSMYAGFDPTGSGWKPEMKEFIDLEPIKNVEVSEDATVEPECTCFGNCTICVNSVGRSQAVHMDCSHCPVHPATTQVWNIDD